MSFFLQATKENKKNNKISLPVENLTPKGNVAISFALFSDNGNIAIEKALFLTRQTDFRTVFDQK